MFSKEEEPEHRDLALMLLEEERDRESLNKYSDISNPFGNIITNVCAFELQTSGI